MRFYHLVYSTNECADERIDDNLGQMMNYFCKRTRQQTFLDLDSTGHKEAHGWCFTTVKKLPGKTLFLNDEQNIAVSGDWFIKGIEEPTFSKALEWPTTYLS